MVVDGPWDFEPLWIVLGLGGFFATFLTGALLLGPRAEKVGERVPAEGGINPSIADARRRVPLLARIDTVVLFLVVADMVIKRTGDDVEVLVGMVALLVLGTVATLAAARGQSPQPLGSRAGRRTASEGV